MDQKRIEKKIAQNFSTRFGPKFCMSTYFWTRNKKCIVKKIDLLIKIWTYSNSPNTDSQFLSKGLSNFTSLYHPKLTPHMDFNTIEKDLMVLENKLTWPLKPAVYADTLHSV